MPKAKTCRYSMKIYKYSMRIYKYSMRFRVPVMDQSDCRFTYNYDLIYVCTQRESYSTIVYRNVAMYRLRVRAYIDPCLMSHPTGPGERDLTGITFFLRIYANLLG